MELRVSSYGSRAELEAYCERLEPEQRVGLSIVGTIEELARFQLGESTKIHGISCIAEEKDSKYEEDGAQPVEHPTRIKSKGYGLNGQLIKPN